MEQETARVSYMVSQCKSYILNSTAINQTVKEGLNPTRYEDELEVIPNYFVTENYQNLTQTIKELGTCLEKSKHPDRLITKVSIQLANATVMFNGQRRESKTKECANFKFEVKSSVK